MIANSPTIIYEYNIGYIEQVSEGFNKRDRTKHLASKLFFAHDLQKDRIVDDKQI